MNIHETAYKTLTEKFLNSDNINKYLDTQTLDLMSKVVEEEYKVDLQSREEWVKIYNKGKKLALMTEEIKNTPWPNASNVKFPLMLQAILNFSSRAYPNLIKDRNVVKVRVIGDDPEGLKKARAERVAEHMNYQLFGEIEDWEDSTDKLLTCLPLDGCYFKKTWFNYERRINVSKAVDPIRVVINYHAKSVEDAPRITHVYTLLPNEIEERIRAGVFTRFDYKATMQQEEEDVNYDYTPEERGTTKSKDPNDGDNPITFLEQHRWWDLDKDGYKEPYIVTMHHATRKVVRTVARFDVDGVIRGKNNRKIIKIIPVQYFTRFIFLQAIDGGIYGMGFNKLLYHMNEIINTAINQLFDAATDQITGGGFISQGVEVGKGKEGGQITFKHGEYHPVKAKGDDLKKNIVPRITAKPSIIHVKLLELIIASGDKMGANIEILSGQQTGSNIPAATTLALIEQGLQMFNAIYKRIYRGFKSEYKKLYRLNRLFLDDTAYYNVLDDPKAIKKIDYEDKTLDISPVSDPNNITNIQKVMVAQELMGLRKQGLDDKEILKRFLEALNVQDIGDLGIDDMQPPEDPEAANEAEKIALENRKIDLDEKKLNLEALKNKYEILKLEADAIKAKADALKSVADAEATEAGPQIEEHQKTIETLEDQMKNYASVIDEQTKFIEGENGEERTSGGPEKLVATSRDKTVPE